jgi:predicted nucleic acid-binding protein
LSVFLDSSALVKRYADEPGADAIRSLPAGVVSALARVEVAAAIWQKHHRLGELDATSAGLLVEQFEWELFGDEGTEPRFAVVALTQRVLEAGSRACARHGLRAYDALQLAAALAAREADPGIDRFACFDRELAAAARLEGFSIVPEA